ncbi:MAG: GNAT family N-acetyltransferase [Chloroflexi bacterium]|jgi:RimJ/RimL family protein N-acetyltransferase|nr:GNAT family N-acetyltransferase [Chloroflexota bacterium]
MVTQQELTYRQLITLRDGARVLLRPLTKDDRQALIDLFKPVSPEERRYMMHDVSNLDLVGSWADTVDYDRVFPMVAMAGDRMVGDATLRFREGPARHRAEIRIFLTKDFRRRGLASRMIQSLIDLAKRRGLYLLEVIIATDRASDIKAFQNLGFEQVCIYSDFWMLPDGDLRDLSHMILRLRNTTDEY